MYSKEYHSGFLTGRMLLTSKCRGERGGLRPRRGALRGHCWWRWRGLRGRGGGRGWWHLPLGSCSGLLGSTMQCVRTAACEVPLPLLGRCFTSYCTCGSLQGSTKYQA